MQAPPSPDDGFPQTFGAVQPQHTPVPQLPQLMVPVPQPLTHTPQFMPAGQVVAGVQLGMPQTFGIPPPPQLWPAGHAPPQVTLPVPQPFPIWPQFIPIGQVVMGVQPGEPQTFG